MVALLDAIGSLGARFTGNGVTFESGDSSSQSFEPNAYLYELNEAYYDNTAYEDAFNGRLNAAEGRPFLASRKGLYHATRGIFNPFRRAVDWYPGAIYPGVMTDDGLPLPDGTPCRVPFDPKTEEPVRLAAMAMLGVGWGNWSEESYVYCRTLPTLGDAFGEIEIDRARGKAYPRLHHPAYVKSLSFNGTGDVIAYTLEIPQVGADNVQYRWGKIVTKETITTLKNGEPFSYAEGEPAEIDNIFGFVPAVWVQFRNSGTQHGQSLVDGVRSKVDRLNSSASSIHDYIAKFSAQGVVFKTSANLKDGALIALNSTFSQITDKSQDEVRFIKGPADLTIDRLIENLGLGDAGPYLQDLIHEIEADLPESVMDRELRQNSDASGVALRMKYGDVQRRQQEACGNADGGLRKLIQMGLAINGHLLKSRAFGPPSGFTNTQRLFQPFDLDSYAKGDLNFSFAQRPLFPDSPLDKINAALLREKLTSATGLAEVGYNADQIYGVGKEPKPKDRPGILEQRSTAQTTASGLFTNAFNSGNLG